MNSIKKWQKPRLARCAKRFGSGQPIPKWERLWEAPRIVLLSLVGLVLVAGGEGLPGFPRAVAQDFGVEPSVSELIPAAESAASSAESRKDWQSPTLRVLSYNVMGIPLPGVDHSRYAEMGDVLAEQRLLGTAPDVVLLQEMFHERTQELCLHSGYPYVVYGPSAKGIRISSGLVILSRFPLEVVERGVFGDCASWDCFARKGFVIARVRLPDGRLLELGNTHLNADLQYDSVTDPTLPSRVRAQQLKGFRAWLSRRQGAGEVLVGGDFNFRGQAPEKADFLNWSGLVDLNQVVQAGAKDGAIDRFFSSAGVANRALALSWAFDFPRKNPPAKHTSPLPGNRLSDHVGVILEINVENER